MAEKISSEQYWKLYKGLPQPLQEALSSDETANNMQNICEKYEITDHASDVVDQMSWVLLGLLLPDEFQKTIEKELGLEKNIAKKVVLEINRFIFYPVKSSLEELYNMEITPPAQMKTPRPATDKEPTADKRKDIYREQTE
ncbi:MAG: hypothetical protein ACKKMP_01755 [Candidatus Nealsonbacteria bacterium]